MLHNAPPGGSPLGLLLPLAIAALVIVLRNRRARRLKIERLWIYPTVLVAFLALSLAAAPPPITPVSLALLIGGFALGAALGWQRGRFTRVDIHPETHDLSTRASPLGLVLIVAILGLRFGLRDLLAENASVLHIPLIAAGEALLVMAVAMMSAQRLELWLRASRMLAEAKAPTTARIVQ